MISRAFAITIAGGAGAGIPARLRWATSTAPDYTSLVVPRGQQRARIGVPISIGSTSPVSLLSRPATTLVLAWGKPVPLPRSEEHTSELQSLMRNSYAVFCFKKKKTTQEHTTD